MAILHSILVFVVISLLTVIVFPILIVISLVGLAGVIARMGRWNMSSELSPGLHSLSLEKATREFTFLQISEST
jgi:hypothetical protein